MSDPPITRHLLGTGDSHFAEEAFNPSLADVPRAISEEPESSVDLEGTPHAPLYELFNVILKGLREAVKEEAGWACKKLSGLVRSFLGL